jgi:sugar transferase (PEP-CTERM/EpsH1 system associated)
VRILFLAHRLPYPPNKGDKIRSFAELAAMSKHHEVDLFCFYDQAEDCQYFRNVRQYCSKLYAEKIFWPRSRMQALLALALGRPFTTAFFHSKAMARRVQEALVSNKYDLVFVFSSSMAPYAESASNVPRLLDMVDVDSDKWAQYAAQSRPPMSWIWRAESKRLAKCEKVWIQDFSLTVLCTRVEAKILNTEPGLRIEAFENYMDANYFDPALTEITNEIRAQQPYVVFTGSMDYLPNVDAVTFFYSQVFPAIRAKVPNAHFVIAGRNPTAAIRKLARDPAVHVTGAVPDIRPYLRGASVAVAPIRVARGVQTKILEALAMGLPVAASRKAAMALPHSLAGAVHVADDPQSLAAFVVEKLLIRNDPSAEIRRMFINFVDKARWEEDLNDLLLQAMRSHTVVPVPSKLTDIQEIAKKAPEI